ncbi:MAG: response regulator transcription factor [Reichenbachiella sp.]|uniref:response regulator transcription factor n=1 Tax=Reichenbachiella sp. TaxID=2184521 RepID=UPI0032641DA7
MKSEKINIVIADDHQMFLDGLTALLKDEKDINLVDTALNGREALEIVGKCDVDILIMDVNMPEVDGIELNNSIKQNHPNVKTLALTSHSDHLIVSKLTKRKVNGYLLKNAEKSELLHAIHKINEGEDYFSQMVKDKVVESLFSDTRDKETPELSKREKEVIKLIASQYTATEIAEELFISQNTVNTHRKNLLTKLKLKNVAGLVKFAVENGFA